MTVCEEITQNATMVPKEIRTRKRLRDMESFQKERLESMGKRLRIWILSLTSLKQDLENKTYIKINHSKRTQYQDRWKYKKKQCYKALSCPWPFALLIPNVSLFRNKDGWWLLSAFCAGYHVSMWNAYPLKFWNSLMRVNIIAPIVQMRKLNLRKDM